MLPLQVPEWAEAIWENGGLLENAVVGFPDCTSNASCMPSKKAAANNSKFSTPDVQVRLPFLRLPFLLSAAAASVVAEVRVLRRQNWGPRLDDAERAHG